MPFENIVAGEEIAHNEKFIHSSHCFLYERIRNFTLCWISWQELNVIHEERMGKYGHQYVQCGDLNDVVQVKIKLRHYGNGRF